METPVFDLKRVSDTPLYTNYYTPDTATDADAGIYISSYNITASTTDVLRVEMNYAGSVPVLLSS